MTRDAAQPASSNSGGAAATASSQHFTRLVLSGDANGVVEAFRTTPSLLHACQIGDSNVIHQAASEGSVSMLTMLVAAAQSTPGGTGALSEALAAVSLGSQRTPLMEATAAGHATTVRLLLDVSLFCVFRCSAIKIGSPGVRLDVHIHNPPDARAATMLQRISPCPELHSK